MVQIHPPLIPYIRISEIVYISKLCLTSELLSPSSTSLRTKARNPSESTKRPPVGPKSREYFSLKGQNQGTPSYVTKSSSRWGEIFCREGDYVEHHEALSDKVTGDETLRPEAYQTRRSTRDRQPQGSKIYMLADRSMVAIVPSPEMR